jgi:c-di-GMP-binding flagellar brake protein YcgR
VGVADERNRAVNQYVNSSPEFSTGPFSAAVRMRRRFEPRHDVETSAVIHLINLASEVQGRILDLSLGGCHIRTERRFPVGVFRRVEVEFRIKGLPFRLGGVTQAIYDGFNVGIRFLDLSDRKREQLLQLIDEIEISEKPQLTDERNVLD